MTLLASNTFPGDGVTVKWAFSFAGVAADAESGTVPYLYPADVKAEEIYTDPLTGVLASRPRTITLSAPNEATVVGDVVPVGNSIRIFRKTEVRFPLVDYRDLQSVGSLDLDLANRQSIFLAQEAMDAASGHITTDALGNYDAHGNRIVNLAAGANPTDAVNKAQMEATVLVSESHALRVPPTDPAIGTVPDAVTRANKLLSFDASGQPQAVAPTSGSAAALAMDLANTTPTTGASMLGRGVQVVNSIAELRLLSKVAPSKYAWMVDFSSGATYSCLYRLLVGDDSSAEFGIATIIAADGGRWRRVTNSRTTDVHFADYGAAIDRSGDRLFVGAAAAHLGTNTPNQPDWFTQLQLAPQVGRTFSFQQTAQFAVLNDAGGNSGNALFAAAQSKHFTIDGNACGILGVAVNNNTTRAYSGAYAGYLEVYQYPDARGPAYCLEIDTINYNGLAHTNPYHQDDKQVNGIQIASGAENANLAAQFGGTNAINLWNNGQTFECGINFGFNLLAGADGTNGTAEAIRFGKGHGMQWWAKEGGVPIRTALIDCETATAAGAIRQKFMDNQVQFRGSNNNLALQVYAVPGAVNFPTLRSSVAGSPVQILANGADESCHVHVVPKGPAGRLRIETQPQSGALTPNSFFEIILADGSTRRVLLG